MITVLCYAAAGFALIFGWSITVELVCGAVFVLTDLDINRDLVLRRTAEYALLVAIVSGTGALLLGGVAGAWALAESIAQSSMQSVM